MNNRISLFVAVFFLTCVIAATHSRVFAGAMNVELINRIGERLNLMRNMQVEFDYTQVSTPPIPKHELEMLMKLRAEGQKVLVPLVGEFNYTCRWTILGENVRFESNPTDETLRKLPGHIRIVSVYNDREEVLYDKISSRTGNPQGMVSTKTQYPKALIDVALGLRIIDEPLLIDTNALSKFDVQLDNELNDVILSWSNKNNHQHVIRLAKKYDLAPIKYQVQHHGEVGIEWNMQNFVRIGEIWHPKKCIITYQNKGIESARHTIQVHKGVLNAHDNVVANYPIVFKNGSDIIDSRIKENFRIVTGDQALNDDKMAEVMGKGNSQTRYWIIAANVAILVAICAFVIYRRSKARGVQGR